MKKLLAVLLALSLLFAFAACGNKEKETPADAETTKTQSEETTVPETTEAVKLEPVKPESVKPEPVVILDNEQLTVTINDAYIDEDMGYTLKATFENKGEKDYTYYIEPSSIDGITVMNYFYTDIAAGKKAVEKIELDDELLRANGVGDYTDIEMTIIIADADDLLSEPSGEYTVHYYPQGEDKAAKFERQPAVTDKILIDNEYITVTATGLTHNFYFECTDLCLYIVNKSDKDISIDAESCSINDIMMDIYFMESVPAGKALFCVVSFDDEEIKEKEVGKISNIEIKLSGYNEAAYLDYILELDPEELLSEGVEELLEGGIESILGGDVDFLKDFYLFEETVVYEP